jgi:amino acid transporter
MHPNHNLGNRRQYSSDFLQLVSSVPSSGGVYHWASLSPGPKYGRVLGFFTGSLNFFGWLFDLSSIAYIMSELVVQMYGLYHPAYVQEAWHVFVALLLIVWICIFITIFFNKYLPYLQQFGLFVVLVGGLATLIVLAAMPKTHSANSFVWTDFQNNTGWGSGFAFLAGVLNGAFTIGTPDAVTHMAEEVPHPRKDLPKAIAAQIILGSLCTSILASVLPFGSRANTNI